MYQDITQLHEEVFEYLMEKRETMPNLYFSMNSNMEDLEKGFLFRNIATKKEDEVEFSFWESSICYFTINVKTQYLQINFGFSMPDKIKVLNTNLYNSLIPASANSSKYIKNYKDWRKGFEYFFEQDFQIIDEFLETVVKRLTKEYFEKPFKQIEYYGFYTPNNSQKPKTIDKSKLNPNLRLQNLSLTNIGHFENISLDLSKQVTVLIGENGSGKSTILRAIALGITGTDFFDLDKDLQEKKNWILGDFLRIERFEKGEGVYANRGEINLTISQEVLQIILQPSTFYKGRIDSATVVGNQNIILNRKKFFNTLIIAFVQDAGKYNPLADISDTSPQVLDLLPMIRKVGQDTMMNLTNWIYYYVQEKEVTTPIEKLFTILSKITEYEIALKKPYKTQGAVGNVLGDINIIIITPQNPDGIHLNLISQGYNNLFRWVGGILMRVYEYQQNFFPEKNLAEISGIVLIDEIDTYLHPKWQRNILKVLVDEFPKLQFVVTTHSMAVISSLRDKNDYLVYKAVKFNNDIFFSEINPLELNPYGADFNEIAEEFMEIPNREPIIQTELDNLASFIAEKNIDKAIEIVNKLNNLINPDNAEFMKLKSRLEAKKLLVK